MTHFELTFVYGWGSFFAFKPMDMQFLLHHLLKSLFFLHWIFFASLPKITWTCFFICFCIFCSISLICVPVPQLIIYCLDYYSYIISFEIRQADDCPFIFFFKIVLVIVVPLSFQINFSIHFSVSRKKSCWDFGRNYIKSLD